MRIILIENDQVLLKTLALLLGKQGDDVVAFSRPAEACSFFELGEPFDLLIVDYMMPELTGQEVLARARSHFTESSRVVLISGHVDLIRTLDLGAMGVDVFLPKPLDLKVLRSTIAAQFRLGHPTPDGLPLGMATHSTCSLVRARSDFH